MRKFLAVGAVVVFGAASAEAADMAVKAPPVVVAPAYSWTGFYAGLNGGYGWGDPSFSVAPDSQAAALFIRSHNVQGGSVNVSGGVAGAQLGYNWQMDPKWVAGLEADIDWANLTGTSSITTTAAFGDTINHRFGNSLDWFGTVRGRLGFLPTENLLIFATGGLAYGGTKVSETTTNLTNPGVYFQGRQPDGSTLFCVGGTCTAGSGSQTSVGWTVGGGLEYAIWKNVTLKAEYLYIDLGDQTVHPQSQSFAGSTPTSIAVTSHNVYNVVRGGINFKF
ncbi:outer membrane protein [Bradyrhizobium erythrophlei]|uniref:outer membrane protein n=1 Tax=Bradyrhizobium erythrophlei TaxID=1437360 RepID=UPI0035EAFD7D